MDLPYFDGARVTLHEGMHAVKNVQECHFRKFFGANIRLPDDLGEGFNLGPKYPSEASFNHATQILVGGTHQALKRLNAKTIDALAYSRGLSPAGFVKDELVLLLGAWVSPPIFPSVFAQ